MEQQEFKADVVIVGAGMAGLAAADYLRRSGITDFVILEASERYAHYLHRIGRA